MPHNFEMQLVFASDKVRARLSSDSLDRIEVFFNPTGLTHRDLIVISEFFKKLAKEIGYISRNVCKRYRITESQTHQISQHFLGYLESGFKDLELDLHDCNVEISIAVVDKDRLSVQQIGKMNLQEVKQPYETVSVPNRIENLFTEYRAKCKLSRDLDIRNFGVYEDGMRTVLTHCPRASKELDIKAAHSLIEAMFPLPEDRIMAEHILEGYSERVSALGERRIRAMEAFLTPCGYTSLQILKPLMLKEVFNSIRCWYQRFGWKQPFLNWPKIFHNSIFLMAVDNSVRWFYDDLFYVAYRKVKRDTLITKWPKSTDPPIPMPLMIEQARLARFRNMRHRLERVKRLKHMRESDKVIMIIKSKHCVPIAHILASYYGTWDNVMKFLKLFEPTDGDESKSVVDMVFEVRNVVAEYYSLMADFSLDPKKVDYIMRNSWNEIWLDPFWDKLIGEVKRKNLIFD